MIFTVGRTYNRLFLVLPEEIGRVNIGHQPQDFAGDPKKRVGMVAYNSTKEKPTQK